MTAASLCIAIGLLTAATAIASAPGGSISGHVEAEDGTPLDGICVDVYDDTGDLLGGDFTDPSGDYSLGGLDTGDYRLRFYECDGFDGYARVDGEFYDDEPDLDSADPVAVTAGAETAGIDAVLAPGSGSISGHVKAEDGTSLEGICVEIRNTESDYRTAVRTDSSGDYTIGSLPAGVYLVQFYDCGTNNVLGEYYDDKPNGRSADRVIVATGTETADIDAELATGGSISGQVEAEDGTPLEDICVEASIEGDIWNPKTEGNFWNTETDGAGDYTIDDLPTGVYRVAFDDCGDNHVVGEYYDDEPDFASADLIAVTAGAETKGIDAALARTGSISGHVEAEDGTPLNHVCLIAYDADGSFAAGASTDTSGDYTVDDLAAGDYRLKFYDCDGSQNLIGEYYDDKPDLDSADPVAVDTGAETVGIDAVLRREGAPPDTTPPDTTIDSGPAEGGTITTTSATFGFHGTVGDTAKLECKLDSAAYAECTSPKTFSGLDDGSHTVSIRARDAAGNADPTPAVRTFIVDAKPDDESACKRARADLRVASTALGQAQKSVDRAATRIDKARGRLARAKSGRQTKQARKRLRRARERLQRAREQLNLARAERADAAAAVAASCQTARGPS